MERQIFLVMALILVVALTWVDAAKAQKTYSLSVSRHRSVPLLSEDEVDRILADASKTLQKNSGHVRPPENVGCNVTFTLKGPVRTFGSPETPAKVDEHHIEAVHRVDSDVTGVDFHVQVVDEITNFCRVPGLGFAGCSYPPEFHSIIVVHPKRHINPSDPKGPRLAEFPDHLLWAHEFGHLTGLGHRIAPRALMTPCALNEQFSDPTDTLAEVTQGECNCMLSGLNSCPLPDPLGCP
jgi:hypothetical protein